MQTVEINLFVYADTKCIPIKTMFVYLDISEMYIMFNL